MWALITGASSGIGRDMSRYLYSLGYNLIIVARDANKLDELKINLDDFLEGPNAILFGASLLEPIKVISEFAKSHDKLDIRVGVISGDVADLSVIKEYASIPSREGLLTMLAGGMMQYVKDLAISLNLYAEQMEGKE